MTVRQYVQANFTEIEQGLFDYMLSSFPETVLVQDGSESEDILALIATLAKVIGSSKELILNLKTAHSLDEIFQKIENSYLAENNKKLLLPFATDLKYHRLPQDLETSELLDRLVDEKYFLLDHYNLYKNRGTLTAITQIVKKWAAYLEQENLIYTLYELKDEVNIVLEGLDEFADFAGGAYNFNFGNETIETTFLRKDIIIFDMLMSIKPVGTNYNILLKYFAFNIQNTINDRVIRERSVFIPTIKLSNAQVQATNPQVVGLVTNEENNQYQISIKNPSHLSSLKAYYADWNNAELLQAGPFGETEENWVELNEAVTPTRDNVNKKNYIFATTGEMFDYLQVRIPAAGTKAIVTGYEWVQTTEADYNIANRKTDINILAESLSFLTPTIFDMQNQIVPSNNVWRGAGSLVVKLTKVFNFASRTRYFRLTQVIAGGYNGGIGTVDSNNFGYFEFSTAEDFSFGTTIIGPNATKTIAFITSTDPNYNALSSFLGLYFTRPEDDDAKSPTTIIPFAALQGGNDKFTAPISVGATAAAEVTAAQNFTLSNITASATASVQTDIDSFVLRARSAGIAFATVQIEGNSFTLNNSSFQETANALSEKTSLLQAPTSIVYLGTTYDFVQWYDVTNQVGISMDATTTFTWDANTDIEARYIPGGGLA